MTVTPIRLSIEEIMQNARKALAERRLQFQVLQDHPEVKEAMSASGYPVISCVYDMTPMGFPGCGCAIGVSLPPGAVDTFYAAGLNRNESINVLVDEGIVDLGEEELERAVLIQNAHDLVVSVVNDNEPSYTIADLIERFKTTIGAE